MATKKRRGKPGPREYYRPDAQTGQMVRYNPEDDLPSSELQIQRPTSSVFRIDYTTKDEEYGDDFSSSDSEENTDAIEAEPKQQYTSLLEIPKVTALLLPGDVLKPEDATLRSTTQSERYDFFDVARNKQIVANANIETDIYLCDKIMFPDGSFVEVEMANNHKHIKHTQHVAVVKTDGQWRKIPGETHEKSIKFAVSTMEGLFVLREPKATHVNLSFDGYTYTDTDDNRIIGEFQKDCIETSTPITITVIPSDTSDDDMDIPQISPCLHVMDNPNLVLKKPVKLQLPLGETGDQDPCEYTTCLLRWKGINVEVAMRDMMTNDDVVSAEVEAFSGYLAANISGTYLLCATSTALSIKILLKAGRLKVCKILTFVDRKDKNSLWFECVLKDKANDVVRHNEKRGLFHLPKSESPDLYLFDGHKVRIYPEGNIQLAKGYPKSKNVLVFLSSGEDNHITYPVEKKIWSGAAYAVLNFESVSQHWQKTLHTFHYLYERDFKKEGTVLPVIDFYSKTAAVDRAEKVGVSPGNTPSASAPVNSPTDQTPVNTKETDTKVTKVTPTVTSELSTVSSRTIATPLVDNVTKTFISEPSTISARSLTTLSVDRTLDDDGLFSDRSLMTLARALPTRLTTQLGVELGLKTNEIDRMKEDRPPEVVMFEVLKKTIISIKLSKKQKLDKLCSAFGELDLNNFADVLQEKFENDECLRKRHFDF